MDNQPDLNRVVVRRRGIDLEDIAARLHVATKTIQRLQDVIAGQSQELKALRVELAEDEQMGGHMAQLLTDTAKALKGPPPKLVWHDWSDLPMVAARTVEMLVDTQREVGTLRECRDTWKAQAESLRDQLLASEARLFDLEAEREADPSEAFDQSPAE